MLGQLSGYFLLCQSLLSATVATGVFNADVVNAVDAADGTDADAAVMGS